MSVDGLEPDASSSGQDWSYTKSQVFQQCPRKFFFNEKVFADDALQGREPSPDAVHVAAIVGIAVHRSIASQIENWKEGEATSFRDAQQEAESWIKGTWAEREERIIEARNGVGFQPSTKERLVGAAKNHLRTFFQAAWPRFRHHEYVLHETLKTFGIDGNRVWTKVDLCTRDEKGNLIITDWKTSDNPVLEVNSLQLDVYALWGKKELEPDIDKIQVQLVHTGTGEFSSTFPDSNQLDTAKEKIMEECETWASIDDIADFTPDPESEKCQSCKFLQICDSGQTVV